MQTKFVKLLSLATMITAGLTIATPTFAAAEITGAGASFPYPIYAKWAESYEVKSGVKLNYQAIGSGGGIKQISNKVVDFGASDKPLKLEELDKKGLMQFPTVVGGVVPVINVPGIEAGALVLSGETLANIYLKKITKWDDAAIVALNPNVKLPNKSITVVHRSDGSGTTFIFTDYLSKVSKEWATKVGSNTAVKWPTGVAGSKNAGVASYVKTIKYSIGYVELAYANENNLTYASMKNKDGAVVQPTIETFQSAAQCANWSEAPGFYEILTNEPGKNSWPIAGATFILMYKQQDNAANAREVLKFFDYAYKSGNLSAKALDYVPLPDNVVNIIKASWKAQIKAKDGSAVWAD
ncbi:MAG: phosphate ABC transporter substrate-binding protein PstS [Methylophilaceae bacterium]|nr:phosphate ABC transporter substrate-binding protein PstS [Methylophilaceae bacterium]